MGVFLATTALPACAFTALFDGAAAATESVAWTSNERRGTASSRGTQRACSWAGVSSPRQLRTRAPWTTVFIAAHPASPERCFVTAASAESATASSLSRDGVRDATCSSVVLASRSTDQGRASDSHWPGASHLSVLANSCTPAGGSAVTTGGIAEANGR